MKRYDEYPTWRMLEEGKRKLKQIMRDARIAAPFKYISIKDAHDSLHRLQLEVEDRINFSEAD